MKDQTADDLRRQADAASSLIAELQSDDLTLNHDMVEGETSLFEAIDAALAEIDECEMTAAGCKAKEDQFATRRQRAERRIERIRALIEQAMLISGLPTVKRDTATISVAELPPKPIISEESEIPAQFWKSRDPVLDKTAINAAVKAGEHIPGVTMTNGTTSLKIRRT